MEAKQQELEYYIYITTNMLNGMQYLGQHTHKVGTKDSYLGSGVRLTNAIKKHKKENFHKEILYYAFDENELNEIEVWYIKHLDAVNDPKFYNLHCGGNVQHGKNNAAYGVKNRKIKCVETGIIYYSIREAARSLGIEHSCIANVCNGKSGTSLGFNWEYLDLPNKTYKPKLANKKVYCVTNDTEYSSIKEASKALKIDRRSIIRVCTGKLSKTKDFIFEYVEEVIKDRFIKIKCLNDGNEFKTMSAAAKFYGLTKDVISYQLEGGKSKSTELKFIKLTD